MQIFKAWVYAFPYQSHISRKNFSLSACKWLVYAQLKMNNWNALYVFPSSRQGILVMYIIVIYSR